MPFGHGKSGSLKIDNSAGTLTDVSAFTEGVEISNEIATHMTTTLGASSEAHIIGLKGATFSVTFLYDRTASTGSWAIITGIYGAAASKTFNISPEGTTSGYPLISGECNLVKFDLPMKVDDKLQFTAQFKVTGDVSFTVNP
jgi:hypothetical protein